MELNLTKKYVEGIRDGFDPTSWKTDLANDWLTLMDEVNRLRKALVCINCEEEVSGLLWTEEGYPLCDNCHDKGYSGIVDI